MLQRVLPEQGLVLSRQILIVVDGAVPARSWLAMHIDKGLNLNLIDPYSSRFVRHLVGLFYKVSEDVSDLLHVGPVFFRCILLQPHQNLMGFYLPAISELRDVAGVTPVRQHPQYIPSSKYWERSVLRVLEDG